MRTLVQCCRPTRPSVSVGLLPAPFPPPRASYILSHDLSGKFANPACAGPTGAAVISFRTH